MGPRKLRYEPNPPAPFLVKKATRDKILGLYNSWLTEVWLELPRTRAGKANPPMLLFAPELYSEDFAEAGIEGMYSSVLAEHLKPHHRVIGEPRVNRETGAVYYRIGGMYKGASFFSNTSKMSCPSWSVPAGPPIIGGSCPGAGPMLETPERQRRASIQQIERQIALGIESGRLDMSEPMKVRGRRLPSAGADPGEPKQFVCDICYAGKANYGNASTQAWQILRFEWFKRWERTDPDELVRQLVLAINHMREYLLTYHPKSKKNPLDRAGRKVSTKHEVWGQVDPNFFRIYDSGDYHSVTAVRVWNEVAKRVPEVLFWAPTRMWWSEKFRREMAKAPKNLAIRPSALHTEDPPPKVKGLAGGSGVSSDDSTWLCPVYTGQARTCWKARRPKGKSLDPGGKEHCRVCWGGFKPGKLPYKQTTVSYHAH